MVDLVGVTDGVLDEEEIELSLRRICLNWYGGPSGMWSEHLKIWLEVAQAEEKLDSPRWWIVVEIIQLLFRTGYFDTYCMWSTIVVILKGNE